MSFHPLTGTPLSFLTGLIFVKSITLLVNMVFMFSSFVFNKNDIQIQITNEFLKHFFDLEHALKHLSCCLQ